MDDGGLNVSTMLVLSSDVVRYLFQSINKSVLFIVVARSKDADWEFGAVASKLGSGLLCLMAADHHRNHCGHDPVHSLGPVID